MTCLALVLPAEILTSYLLFLMLLQTVQDTNLNKPPPQVKLVSVHA